MKDYLTARREAGTARGDEFVERLTRIPPSEAADEIMDMFSLCADEDLVSEISCDLQMPPWDVRPIAAEIVRRRERLGLYGELDQRFEDEIERLHEAAQGFVVIIPWLEDEE